MKLLRQILLMACALASLTAYAADVRQQEDRYRDALQAIAEGRRNDASRELSKLIENEPEHAGAWLDAALVQCALGNADKAEKLFAVIETRFQPNAELQRLIAEARDQGCARWRPASTVALSLGRGVDQNVNQGASSSRYLVDGPDGQIEHELTDDFKPRHDQYTVLAGEYSRELTRNGTTGFAQLLTRQNDHLSQYNSLSLLGGVEQTWRIDRWTVRTTGTAGLVSLGGHLYQRQTQLQARVAPPLPLPESLQFQLVGSVTHANFLRLTNFDSNMLELRGQLTWRHAGWFTSASVARIEDHALALRPGGDRSGWYGNLLARRRLTPTLAGELGYTRQNWDSSSPYAPGVIEQVRAQTTQIGRASLAWTLSRNHSLQLEARAVRNRENISIFRYNDRLLQVSWQWQDQGP